MPKPTFSAVTNETPRSVVDSSLTPKAELSSKLDDPTSKDPLTAYAMDKGALKRLMDRNPITKEDLKEILKSDQLSKQEILELLEEYSK
jgi:hypothetical protein